MEIRTKSGFLFVLLSLLLVAMLNACGSDTETIPPATGTLLTASTPTAGLNACVRCHSRETADWLTSKHANLDPGGDLNSPGLPDAGYYGDPPALCTPCHDPLGDSRNLTAGYTGAAGIKRPVVGCESCHGPGSLHAEKGGVGPISLLSGTLVSGSIGTVQVSGQFRMCTSCHQLLDSATGGVSTFKQHGDVYTSMNEVIWDTHFATGGNYNGNKGANTVLEITGYVMNFADDTVCTDCHNPHKKADINREWAASGHAFRGPENPPTTYNPWSHYNWSCNATANCGGQGAKGDRRACQRCHTTSAFSRYADALAGGNAALAKTISTSGTLAYNPNFKPEMLECKGCHTDNRGTLRNPGAYTADYGYSTAGAAAAAEFSYPEASSSNLCILCHSARQSGDTVRNLVFSNPSTTNFSNLSFINPHYLGAAGTMFAAAGYEFSGRSYANPVTFKHSMIGTSAEPNTGSGGPCVGCHMERGESANHLFRAVSKDINDKITAVVSEVCYQCHAGSSTSLAETVETEKTEYEEAIAALINQLDKKGVSFYPGSPYIFQQRTIAGTVAVANGNVVTGTGTDFVTAGTKTTDYFRVEVEGKAYGIASVDSATQITLTTNYTGPGSSNAAYVIITGTAATNWRLGGSDNDGRNNLGAAFNLQFLEHEPGGYIHNSKYVKRLIYDSIDWLDNGSMDFSVGKTLDALPAETAYKAGAMTYLLQNGVLWNDTGGYGVDSERPY